MSFSNPETYLESPCQYKMRWSSKKQALNLYNVKTKEQTEVAIPLQFIVLDRYNSVTGYNKKVGDGIFSNIVRDTRSEQLDVRFFKNGPIAKGLWANIKDDVEAKKGGFTQFVYTAIKLPDHPNLVLCCLELAGGALGEWFSFAKTNKRYFHLKSVVIKGSVEKTTGSVDYTVPVFDLGEFSEDSGLQAAKLDMELQQYFDAYFEGGSKMPNTQPPPSGGEDSAPADLSNNNDSVDDLPF